MPSLPGQPLVSGVSQEAGPVLPCQLRGRVRMEHDAPLQLVLYDVEERRKVGDKYRYQGLTA